MNIIPTLQEANKIDGNIVSFEIFWGPIEKGTNAPYFNNFFAYFQSGRKIQIFKEFLDDDPSNFEKEKISTYVYTKFGPRERWENYSITDESIKREIIMYLSFAEYYRAFPEKVNRLVNISNDFKSLSKNIIDYVAGKSHELTSEYTQGLYHAYTHMRTQPGTSDAIITA